MDDQTPTIEPKQGMNPMFIVGIVVLLLLIGGGVFLSMRKTTPSQQTMQKVVTPTAVSATTPTEAMQQATPTAMTATAKEFTVHGGSFYMKPSLITVKKGDTVKITFINDGGFHDFVLDAFNIKTDVMGSGKSTTVTFVADKVGSFPYYCSVSNHRAMGMQGTLVVN